MGRKDTKNKLWVLAGVTSGIPYPWAMNFIYDMKYETITWTPNGSRK